MSQLIIIEIICLSRDYGHLSQSHYYNKGKGEPTNSNTYMYKHYLMRRKEHCHPKMKN